MDQARLQRLVEAFGDKVDALLVPNPKPAAPAAPGPLVLDSVSRDAIHRRVRDLERMYRLTWLINQEAFHVPGIECLEDEELADLLKMMEQARECIVEGVPFDDAGLVRSCAMDC